MEAKDTVMSDKQLDQYCKDKVGHQAHVPNSHDRKVAQAKISFKAGQESEVDHSAELCAAYLDASKKAGMQEVVAWGEEPCPHWISKDHTRRMKRLCPDCWQAFLKERGLEK